MPPTPVVDFGSEICGSLDAATEREWLVTNGIGGYASGTISGILTRRYHGLLVAALEPPGQRTLLIPKVDETLAYDGRSYPLGANRWDGGSITPEGFRLLERFRLEGTTPIWTFACGDALLEKRVWMQGGSNTTFVEYELMRGAQGGADLEIKVIVDCRDYHAITRAGDWPIEIAPVEHGLRVMVLHGRGGVDTAFYLLSDAAQAEPRQEWYRGYELACERERGLGDLEDHLFAGLFRARLAVHRPLMLVFTTEPQAVAPRRALEVRAAREEKLLEYWIAAQPEAALHAPPWIRQLVLAAAQFVVNRPLRDDPGASAILAGYPWFGEWSRDSMIALPGVTLETGRAEIARSILKSAAAFLDQGMLPNVFPEALSSDTARGALLNYNSADAVLWFFEALRHYLVATADKGLIGELYEALAGIIDWHVRGTRYSIRMDEADGLLHAGEPGVQLTWMDARVGDQVVTARIGKPVEINALWYNALRTMAGFSFELGRPTEKYVAMAQRTQAGFARFWNQRAGYCFDVLDGPQGDDPSLRPNQIFAVSLPESPLEEAQRKGVVDICARRLITPYGLRTLDPDDPRYQGVYEGSPAQRDGAYHQGTAWSWLLGPFVLAHLRVYRDPVTAASFLQPIASVLAAYGLGTVNEIFDGDPPWHPRGTIAQAWSVGEVLRAWRACNEAGLLASEAAAG